MPLVILAGDEEFELSRRAQSLKEKLLDPTWASVNFQRLENAPIQDLIEAAAQLPFGPGNKVIINERCDLFTKKRSKSGDEESSTSSGGSKKGKDKDGSKDKASFLDQFEEAMSSIAPNTYLILCCPYNFDSTLKTSKAVSKSSEIERFEKERYYVGSKNYKLETWCRKEAKRFGATIDDAAISYLLDGLEAELRAVSAEIEKASTFILPKTHITIQVVEQLTPFHSHVFVLADKWISGRKVEAFDSLRELLSRQSGMPIIAMMQTMLSKWIQIKLLVEKFNHEAKHGPGMNKREIPIPELAKKVAAVTKAHPMVVENDLKRIAREESKSLIRKKVELTRLEHLVKTGQLPEGHALELMLAM